MTTTICIDKTALEGFLRSNHNSYQELTGDDMVEEILSMIADCERELPTKGQRKDKRKTTDPVDPCRCLARIWNGGRGGQCSKKAKADGFCAQHMQSKECAECGVLHAFKWQHLGRVDQPLSALENAKARQAFLKAAGTPECMVVTSDEEEELICPVINTSATKAASSPTKAVPSPTPSPTKAASTPAKAKPTLQAPPTPVDDELVASPIPEGAVTKTTPENLTITAPVEEDDSEEEDSEVESDDESESDDDTELPEQVRMKQIEGIPRMLDNDNNVWNWHTKEVIGTYDPETETFTPNQ